MYHVGHTHMCTAAARARTIHRSNMLHLQGCIMFVMISNAFFTRLGDLHVDVTMYRLSAVSRQLQVCRNRRFIRQSVRQQHPIERLTAVIRASGHSNLPSGRLTLRQQA
jgi:hypothetical protein